MADRYLEATIADARLTELDERKLMPLDKARELVGKTDELKGFGEETDQVWAALVSLEDAEEFVREGSRITWRTHPRGHDNIALFERYGAGIFPWLTRFYDAATGSLRNTPWCIRPLLLELGTPEAFAIVWGTRTLEGFDVGDQLIGPWMARFADVGFAELGKLAAGGDERAKKELKRLAKGRTRRATAAVEKALGAEAGQALAKKLKLVAKLEAAEIVSALDDAAAKGEIGDWPRFSYGFEDTAQYFALRLVVARAKDSDVWGLALERLTGCHPDELSFNRYLYGSEVVSGLSIDQSPQPELDFGTLRDTNKAVGTTVKGPGGALTLTAEEVTALDLRPGESTEGEGVEPGEAAVLLRAYLSKFPGTLWPKVEDTLAALKVPADGALIICVDQFEHTADDELPGASRTYKSLAQALVMRKAEKFKPGESNTDWRLHLA